MNIEDGVAIISKYSDPLFVFGETFDDTVHSYSSNEKLNSPKLLDQVRDKLRGKHYAIRTEHTYLDWIKRYIDFHDKADLPQVFWQSR